MHQNDANDTDDAPDRWFLEPFTSRDVAGVASSARADRAAVLEAASQETALALARDAIARAVRDGTIAARFNAFIAIEGLERRARSTVVSGSVKAADDAFDRAEIDDVAKELFLDVQSGDEIKEMFDDARRIRLFDETGKLEDALELVKDFEKYARSEDSKVVRAAVWCGAWSAIQNELFRRSEWIRVIEKLFWTIHMLCLSHRIGDIRACAAMQCGELATAAMLKLCDLRVHEAYARDMLRLSLDEKYKVRHAVSCSVSMCFVRRIDSGLFTVREADAALLCAMFVSAVGKRNPFAHIDYVNKAHLTKTMNEGCASVTHYALERMIQCMLNDQLWRTDDKDILGRRLRACALIVEHVGDRVAPFIDSIIKMLLDTLTKSFVRHDAEYLMEMLMIYAPSTRRTWVAPTMLHVKCLFATPSSRIVTLWVCESFLSRIKQHGVTHVLNLDDVAFISENLETTIIRMDSCDVLDRSSDVLNVVQNILASCLEILSKQNKASMTMPKFKRLEACVKIQIMYIHACGKIPIDATGDMLMESCTPKDEVEASEIFRLIVDRNVPLRSFRANTLTSFFWLLTGTQLVAEISKCVAQRIDPATCDGSLDSLLTVKDFMIPFILYVRSRGDETLTRADFVTNVAPVLDSLLDWMRWRPGEMTAQLADIAATCFAVESPFEENSFSEPISYDEIGEFVESLTDEQSEESALQTFLTRWLSLENRSKRVIDVICSMSFEKTSSVFCRQKRDAMLHLQKCACLADRQNALKFLERVASRYLKQVTTSPSTQVRVRSLLALGKTIAELMRDFNDHPTAKKFVGDIFVFADDADEAVRVGACRVLGALQHCHSHCGATIVRGLLDSGAAKYFIHKDALQCLEDPEVLEKEFRNDARWATQR